jgi:hypothetical protein
VPWPAPEAGFGATACRFWLRVRLLRTELAAARPGDGARRARGVFGASIVTLGSAVLFADCASAPSTLTTKTLMLATPR